MAKKTVKPAQQRTKEDQWRRRMAQQSQTGASNIAASADSTATALVGGEETEAATVKVASTARRSAGAAATAQRATASAARGARSRIAAASMSLDEEMGYIRTDIRKLVALTSMCVVVIIALAFILPSII